MRVGIYSRWIDTLGGGEQTLGAFAATLAEHHDVDLITHEAPDWSRFQDTLGLDLRDLTTRVLPYDRDHYRPLQTATKDYDLFINCSYLDPVRAYARVNVLQVFFPPAAPPVVHGVTPVPRDSTQPQPPLRPIGGLHLLERDRDSFYAWTDGHARFALRPGVDCQLPLTLRLASARPRHLAPAAVDIAGDGATVRKVRLPARGYVDVHVQPADVSRNGNRAPIFLDVRSDTFDPSLGGGDERTALGVRVAAAGSVDLERWTDHRRYVDAIGTYELLLSNSHFTQRWVAQRYGRASELLYPPVQVGQFAPGPKKQRIISVGRFFVDGHTKKQLEMIQLFRRLCDGGLTGWEYHLAGGTHHDSRSARYFEDCRAATVGYPITLHPDAPLSELVELYAGSVLYWNATGYGEDPDLEPDRFEHFGMTTVEAMASGCVPLSYARAGQPEVIEHEQSGILWETLEELAAQTLALVDDPSRRSRLAAAAERRSNTFTFDRFRVTLQRLLADTRLYA
jgi:glycosyltransferase involved in cell wall biosynthesis